MPNKLFNNKSSFQLRRLKFQSQGLKFQSVALFFQSAGLVFQSQRLNFQSLALIFQSQGLKIQSPALERLSPRHEIHSQGFLCLTSGTSKRLQSSKNRPPDTAICQVRIPKPPRYQGKCRFFEKISMTGLAISNSCPTFALAKRNKAHRLPLSNAL